jgi:two-component system nitrogen regulation response regulator NtrX
MGTTILIVDDEKNIRRTVRMVLEGEGFSVEEAGSGEETLARLPDIVPDVILLDVQLPGISGHEVLESLRKARPSEDSAGPKLAGPDPLVIMISGHGTLADAVRATKAGAYDFLEKPLDRERLMVTLRNALERRAMAREVAGLRALTEGRFEMVGQSPAMVALYGQIAKVAPTRTRVLITGESGTGKELVARAIHRESSLRDRPFIKVNCAAIPPELIESELFGHERGAFTGAAARKKGLFELADGGTIFLDEIGDMSLSAQAKVLRVLQSGELSRVGSETTLKVDVRVLAATNRDLQAGVAGGQFREDLFFRLAVVPGLRRADRPRKRPAQQGIHPRGRLDPLRLRLARQRSRAAQRGRAAGHSQRGHGWRRRAARGDRRRGGAPGPPAAQPGPPGTTVRGGQSLSARAARPGRAPGRARQARRE